MKKKSSSSSCWPNIRKKLKVIDIWIYIVVVVIGSIWLTRGLINIHHDRKLIEEDPVKTAAKIINIGRGGRDGGPPVYYEFQINDSTYQGKVFPGKKESKNMRVGQYILIVYQRTDPSNARYYDDATKNRIKKLHHDW